MSSPSFRPWSSRSRAPAWSAGRAKPGLLDVAVHDLRDFTTDRHRTVDDAPYGGGPGMVLKVEPFMRAVEHVRGRRGQPGAVVLLSPQGETFTHEGAVRLSRLDHLVLLCGRYQGVDERVREAGGHGRDLDRRLRPERRRAGGGRGARRRGAAGARRRGKQRVGGDRLVRAADAGPSDVHASGQTERACRAGGAGVGRPWGDPALAEARGCEAPRSAAGPICCGVHVSTTRNGSAFASFRHGNQLRRAEA